MNQKSSRRDAGIGVKAFIASASLAATLGGWAALSASQFPPSPTAVQSAVVQPANSSLPQIILAPLPTVVPPPDLNANGTQSQPQTNPNNFGPQINTNNLPPAPFTFTHSSR